VEHGLNGLGQREVHTEEVTTKRLLRLRPESRTAAG
jgi:hypothetical protein